MDQKDFNESKGTSKNPKRLKSVLRNSKKSKKAKKIQKGLLDSQRLPKDSKRPQVIQKELPEIMYK